MYIQHWGLFGTPWPEALYKLMFYLLTDQTQPELEVRRHTPVWYTGTSLVGLKSYRHFILADCHTGMPCTKFGQLIVRKIIKIVAYRCVS